MRDKYEPFQDCISNSKMGEHQRRVIIAQQDIHVLWVVAAVQMVVGLAYAYDTLKNNGSDTTKLLTEINNTLQGIKSSLDQVNRDLDRIMDVLMDLPRVMQGAVDNGLMRQALGKCASRVTIIKDKMKPGIFEQNIQLIDNLCTEIQVEIGGVQGLSGAKGMLLAAPYFTVWLAARVAIEKEKLRREPNRIIESPWQLTWAKEVQALFSDVWISAANEDIRNERDVLPKMPPHMQDIHLRKDGTFGSGSGDSVKAGRYRLTCPGGVGVDEELQRWGADPFKPSSPGRWWAVDRQSTSDAAAVSAHNNVLSVRKELVAFYTLMPELFKQRSSVMDAFIEPTDYWK